MDYHDATSASLAEGPDDPLQPEVVRRAGPARRLRDACEPLAMHAVWSRTTNERLGTLGLDFLGSYVLGRAACLGEPVGAVVAAAFAWFEPGLVASAYDTARAVASPSAVLAERDAATLASLGAVLAGEDTTEVADVLADAVEGAEGSGRPLFSGLRARGRPADPVQRLWWACDALREHRGDSHIAASAAAGVGPIAMNILTELWIGMPLLSYTATRGWPPAAMSGAVEELNRRGWMSGDRLSDAGRAVRVEIEARTDGQAQSIVDALGDRFDDVCAKLNEWSGRCVAAGSFPTDILKRAAG